jgi:EAL domain-containing protein (putative c-di-GMP-specific phosphodiesterase class I)
MREALAEDRMVLVAQPLISLDPRGAEHDRVDGFELLVRLREPDGTLVLPGAFLPAVERYNLATRLDRWVVGEAVRQLGERPRASGRIDLWTVNVSGYTLADEEFFSFIAGRLRRWPALGHRLCIEITESAAARDPRQARRLTGNLRAVGCRIALDDFGSGFSSMGYLRQLEVDILKIFGSLVRSVPEDPLSEAMVRAVHEVARAAGLRTVAEFVESDDIRESIRRIGVDFGQGLALGAPQLLTEVLDRLDSGASLAADAFRMVPDSAEWSIAPLPTAPHPG